MFTTTLLFGLSTATATPPERPTVMFVHGMFMTGDSWRDWCTWFEEREYTCVAPSWPGRDGEPADLRNAPPAVLEELTLTQVVDHHARLLDEMDTPPYLIGHSMGGLVVQLLLQRGYGRAGVAIDSAPPKGVSSLKWSFIKSNAAILKKTTEPINPSEAWFGKAFAHTLDADQVHQDFVTYVVPESRTVGKGPTTDAARIDFDKARAPLLMVGGQRDRIIPAGLSRRNAKRYGDSAPTTYTEFAGRTHWIVVQPGWEEVAEHTHTWLQSNEKRP